MAKIIKVYQEAEPAGMLLGKLYHDGDRDEHGTFSKKWEEWCKAGWFEQLCAHCHAGQSDYVGAMRMHADGFEYWIGVIAAPGTAVPDGFSGVALPASNAAVAWIKGTDGPALYAMHEACMRAFAENGWSPADDAWYIERYNCPRYTQPDENGEVILDYVVYTK